MAQLTTTQKSQLLNSSRFLSRIQTAAAKSGKYWNDYTIDTFAKYNIGNQKRKVYARAVLSGIDVSRAFATSFLATYSGDISGAGILEDDQSPFNAETNQLSDTELNDSGATAYAYDYLAGLKTADDSTQIQL